MSNEHGSYMDAAVNYDGGVGLRFRGTCIRFENGQVHTAGWFDSGGPYVHANSAHISIGVENVRVDDSGRLVIETDGMAPVVACLVSGDETLSARGIFGGASVGVDTVITFHDAGSGRLYLNQQADWDAIAGTYCNVWVLWISVAERQ
jgi:hypothetical protein